MTPPRRNHSVHLNLASLFLAGLFAILALSLVAMPALQAAPVITDTSWRDDFDDDTGLSQKTDVHVADGQLSLDIQNEEWLQTTQADFQSGELSNLDSTSAPGSLLLDQLPFAVNNQLTTEAGWQYRPAVALGPDGDIYLLWWDSRGLYGIYAAHSADGGATWSESSHVSWDSDNLRPLQIESVVVRRDSVGTLHAIWIDNRPSSDTDSDQDVYYAHSSDGGETWSTNIRLNDDTGTATQKEPTLVIAPDGSALYAAWTDGRNTPPGPGAGDDWDIYFARSTNGGATWGPNKRLDDGPQGTEQRQPTLAIDADANLYAAWRDARNATENDATDIYFNDSANGGQDWSSSSKINTEPPTGSPQSHPGLVAFGASPATLTAIWTDGGSASCGQRVVGASSTDGGATWPSQVPVDQAAGYGCRMEPRLATSASGAVFAAWTRYKPQFQDPDIYAARSFDGGLNWTAPEVVSLHNGEQELIQRYPALAVTGDSHAVFAFQEKTSAMRIYVAPDAGLAASGTYTSAVWSTGGVASWGEIRWEAQVPGTAGLAIQTRTGGTEIPDGTWSPWSTPYSASGQTVTSPPAQYLQCRATLTRGGLLVSPMLSEVSIAYSHYTSGQATSLLIQPQTISQWGLLLYSASKPPGTSLSVDVLDQRGTVLFSNVPSGMDLSLIDASQYPTLRLRSRLESPDGMASPALDSWKVSWSQPPTATPTPTDTPSPTPSPTGSATPTATTSPTPTVTTTPGDTPTASPSPSATGTATPTDTATPTATKTATPTYTSTATPTDTVTPTATKTATPTYTPTATATSPVGKAYLPMILRFFP